MPTNYIKSIHERVPSLSIEELESIWEEAKKSIDEGKKKYFKRAYFAVVTSTFKTILKSKLKDNLKALKLLKLTESTLFSFKEFIDLSYESHLSEKDE